ncbi:MAG: hypothetical protein ACREM3_08130 [Candidatus Rokuibacteriota bacterium]
MRVPLLALLVVLAVVASGGGASAQTALPDVEIVLIVEVQDAVAWAALHQEVIATVGEGKPLRATLPAGTGGDRSVIVYQPKFTASVITADGRRLVKVGVAGKLRGAEALGSMTAFEMAAVDIQAGAIGNDLGLLYGLSSVNARLVELHLGRP